MTGLLQDLRYAVRQFQKSAGFLLTAVLTLAIGLGSASAIFCLMDTLWLHPVHVPHAERLVRVFSTTLQDQEGSFSYFEYQTLAQRMPAFSGLAALGGRGSLMPRPDGTSQLLLTNVVSSNFFDVLGVRPLLGHLFTGADAARFLVHPAIVLGYRCWQRDFNADPTIIGKSLPLRHGKERVYQAEVLGVLPPSFRDIDPNSDRDLWMPAEVWSANVDSSDLTSHSFRWFNLVGRLAPGVTASQANAQAAAVASALQGVDPANNHNRGARAVSDFAYRMNQAGTSGIVLVAIVVGVVLLTTINVAHLLLARALARMPGIALRLSLGATRAVVARQFLVENLLLILLGWAASLAVATGIVALLPRLLVTEPAMLNSYGSGVAFQLDWRFFSFAGLLALVTMLVLAFVPLAQVMRSQLVPALQSQAGRITAHASLARRAIVWLQIAVSFALLVSTGALVRSFLNTQTHPIGLTRNQVLVAFTQDPDDATRETVLADLRALPGVRAVGYGIRSPLMPSEGGIAIRALLPSHPEFREPVSIKFNAVSPGFLGVTGTRVLRGRDITDAEDHSGSMTVLINRTMAEKYFSGSDPIGQLVRIDSGTPAGFVDARILGVTEDAPINQIGELPEPFVYVPFHQYTTKLSNMGEMTLVLSTAPNAMSLAQSVRQALIHVNPLLDPMFITSQPELLRYSAGNYRMMAELVTALGFIGLSLTIVGLYGFLAFRVTQRRREIGIRMALGATQKAATLLVLADTSRLAAIGLGIGLVLSFIAARMEKAVLFGVSALDALSIGAALSTLAVAMIIAAWLPARRTASIEPMEALRYE